MTSEDPFLAGKEIDLGDCVLVTIGKMRNIHAHESLPGLLIKTIKPERLDRTGQFKPYHWWKRFRHYGAYVVFHREIAEFVLLCRRFVGHNLSTLPFARIHGLVMTNAGLGIVVERISGSDGRLAPSLRSLTEARLVNDRHLRALDRLLDRGRDMHIVFGDLNPRNIVYTEVRDPEGEFVCIDGLGEKATIPVHRWSKLLNDRKIERQRQRLHLSTQWYAPRRSDPEGTPQRA